MGYLKYIKALYAKPKANLGDIYRERLVELRKSDTIEKLEHPTRMDKARTYGYKAKKGFLIARVKVRRGGKMRPHFMGGRKTKQYRRRKVLEKNYAWIAEEKAARKYKNCEVLGSYWIAKDGINYWFEVVLGDRNVLKTYNGYKHWIAKTPGKVFRGVTSSNKV